MLSWNVAKRRDCAGQASAVAGLVPDVVVFQEVNPRTWPRHVELLSAAGLAYALSALDATKRIDGLAKACFVGVLSRWPLEVCTPARVRAKNAILCATVATPWQRLDVIGVHIPTIGGPHAALKLGAQQGLLARMRRLDGPAVVCGDFNSPRAEATDGGVLAFARRPRERSAELALMGRTNACGLIDAFRARHGYEADGRSWYWKNRGRIGGYRLDHIFSSDALAVVECEYVHEWRTRGLSDHSGIYADVAFREHTDLEGCPYNPIK